MTLQEKMDEYKKNFEATVPKDALEIMHRATQALKDSEILEHVPKPGDLAPDFILENTDGEKISLKQLLKEGPIVLGFYRGQW